MQICLERELVFEIRPLCWAGGREAVSQSVETEQNIIISRHQGIRCGRCTHNWDIRRLEATVSAVVNPMSLELPDLRGVVSPLDRLPNAGG